MSDLIERANTAIGGGALNSNLIGALRDEIERLTARLIAESGEVEDLVNRLQESEDDNGRLMKRIAKLEDHCDRLTKTCSALANSEVEK